MRAPASTTAAPDASCVLRVSLRRPASVARLHPLDEPEDWAAGRTPFGSHAGLRSGASIGPRISASRRIRLYEQLSREW